MAPPGSPDADEQALIDGAGRLEGLRVLDLGCGDGELTFHLYDAGALVSGLDISPDTIELARRRFERYRPDAEVDFRVGPAEDTPFEDASFDVVVGKWILHHIDVARAADEVARLLRPGGKAVFAETSGSNRLLALARERIVHQDRLGTYKSGTIDEHPLTRADLDVIGARFRSCRVDYPVFRLLHLFDRAVLRFRWPAVSRPLARVDAALGRVERLGALSYYVRVTVEK